MRQFLCKEIGRVKMDEAGFYVEVLPEYRAALKGIEGFSHIQLIWWFDGCDNETDRSILTETKPYRTGPEEMGVFATRSPHRPNPVAITCAYVTYVDADTGIVGIAYTDAYDGTPVLDIKPYTPSLDKSETCSVPDWCSHWPNCLERSGDFDWEAEIVDTKSPEPQIV